MATRRRRGTAVSRPRASSPRRRAYVKSLPPSCCKATRPPGPRTPRRELPGSLLSDPDSCSRPCDDLDSVIFAAVRCLNSAADMAAARRIALQHGGERRADPIDTVRARCDAVSGRQVALWDERFAIGDADGVGARPAGFAPTT